MTKRTSLPDRGRRNLLKWAGGIALGTAAGVYFATQHGMTPVVIAAHPWPGYEFMFLARERGWLPPEEVAFLETTTISASLEAFLAGKVDGAALTLDEVIDAVLGGTAVTVVLLFDVSAGADAVLARAPIARPADLRRCRIGAEHSSLGRLMVNKLLAAGDLERDEVDIVYFRGPHDVRWRQGGLDAIVTHEPFASMLETAGAARIYDSRELPHTIFDVLAFRSDRLQGRGRHLTTLLRGHFRALKAWNTNPVDTAYRLSRHYATTADRLTAQFHGVALPDLAYNRHLLGPRGTQLRQAVEALCVALELPPAVRPQLAARLAFDDRYLPADHA